LRVTDALGLFAQTQEVDPGLLIESLPRSLLMEESPMLLSVLVQGDVPTGGRGSGQELYAIEPYSPGSDARDLMWKRMARSSDEATQVRVREASAKASVTVMVWLGAAQGEPLTRNVDLVSEALAQLGRKLTSVGVTLRLACYRDDGLISRATASSVSELAAAVVGIWTREPLKSDPDRVTIDSDLVILDRAELADIDMEGSMRDKTTLLVWDGHETARSGGRTFVFSGTEDLTTLAEVLLES
jgi:uncharacterized protein (DUF58 family)